MNKHTEASSAERPGTGEAVDKLAAYRDDLSAAERQAGRSVDYSKHLPLMALGFLLPFVAIFMPHSGEVLGFDVLFHTQNAQRFATTNPERIFAWLSLTASLLTVGTIVSRSWIVAWVNWAFSGVAWWYSIVAIWMRQTRPPTAPGEGPGFGLIMAAVGLVILFATMSAVIFRKSPLQKALAQARREEAHKDEASRLAQQRLRTGLKPREDYVLEDDRRARAKARRRKSGD